MKLKAIFALALALTLSSQAHAFERLCAVTTKAPPYMVAQKIVDFKEGEKQEIYRDETRVFSALLVEGKLIEGKYPLGKQELWLTILDLATNTKQSSSVGFDSARRLTFLANNSIPGITFSCTRMEQ